MTPYLAQRRDELIRTYRDGLLQDVIPFWLKHGLDRKHGGIHTALGRRGELLGPRLALIAACGSGFAVAVIAVQQIL